MMIKKFIKQLFGNRKNNVNDKSNIPPGRNLTIDELENEINKESFIKMNV